MAMLFDPSAAASSSSSSAHRNPEFIAIIMAGEGNDSWSSGAGDGGGDDGVESSSSTGEKLLPKALQQVDGKPRLDGILKWIEEGGVTDAVVLAPEWQHPGISSYLRSRRSASTKEAFPGEAATIGGAGAAQQAAQPQLKIDLELLDEDHRVSENEALRTWNEKNPYKSADLIVLPSDFLNNFGNKFLNPPPPLTTILDKHRLDENLVTTAISEKKPITSKKQKEAELPPLLIAYDPKTSTLLDVRDLDEFEEDVAIRNTLIRKYPALSLSTVLQLSYVYVCSPQILAILQRFPELKRFDDQVIPWLCKAQWQKDLLTRNRKDPKPLSEVKHSQANALARSSTRTPTRGSPGYGFKVACIIQRQS